MLEEEEESVCLEVCFVLPLAALSDIWQGDFLACGQAERGERSVRRAGSLSQTTNQHIGAAPSHRHTLMYSQAD